MTKLKVIALSEIICILGQYQLVRTFLNNPFDLVC